MIISQTSVEPKQMPPCQTLQVLSIFWMLLAQCSRKRLVKWSFRSQKLRRSVQNAGHLIRAPARNSGRRGATLRTGEGVEGGERRTRWRRFSFLQMRFGVGFRWLRLGAKLGSLCQEGFRLRWSYGCGGNKASQQRNFISCGCTSFPVELQS